MVNRSASLWCPSAKIETFYSLRRLSLLTLLRCESSPVISKWWELCLPQTITFPSTSRKKLGRLIRKTINLLSLYWTGIKGRPSLQFHVILAQHIPRWMMMMMDTLLIVQYHHCTAPNGSLQCVHISFVYLRVGHHCIAPPTSKLRGAAELKAKELGLWSLYKQDKHLLCSGLLLWNRHWIDYYPSKEWYYTNKILYTYRRISERNKEIIAGWLRIRRTNEPAQTFPWLGWKTIFYRQRLGMWIYHRGRVNKWISRGVQ